MLNKETVIDGDILFLYQEVEGKDNILLKFETSLKKYNGEDTLYLQLFGYGVDNKSNTFYEEIKFERKYILDRYILQETINGFLNLANSTFKISPTNFNDLIEEYSLEMSNLYLD